MRSPRMALASGAMAWEANQAKEGRLRTTLPGEHSGVESAMPADCPDWVPDPLHWMATWRSQTQ